VAVAAVSEVKRPLRNRFGSETVTNLYRLYQWLRFGFDPFITITALELEEAEIIPGKHSDTRIKRLALTNGHGRYMAVTPERTLASVGECPLHI
jgi:hypothetical protein